MNASGSTFISLVTVVLSAGLLAPASALAQASGHAPDGENRPAIAIQELSEPELKSFYADCTRAALEQALSGAAIALCSTGYELLLARSFGGDFYALLAWSRGRSEGLRSALTAELP